LAIIRCPTCIGLKEPKKRATFGLTPLPDARPYSDATGILSSPRREGGKFPFVSLFLNIIIFYLGIRSPRLMERGWG
jgi:hypothetical protein